MKLCKVCGATIITQASTGRPATYCSTPCRRLAELEIRRINTRLAALESQAQRARDPRDTYGRLVDPAHVAAEIERATDRLRALLAD